MIEILHLIDIGNTSATYGLAQNSKLKHTESLSYDDIPQKILKNAKKGFKYSNIVVISSVVPQKTEKIVSVLYSRGNWTVYEIGKHILVPVKDLYKNSKKLGIDRRINAYGAIQSKKTPCLVFDYGTALTCDLIDKKGVFLGGLIIPGPATSLRSLLANTAQLPKAFNLKQATGKPYGRSTDECIQKGVIQAYAAMTDGLIARLSKEFKQKPHVIITGGFSAFIGKIMQSKAEINPEHTLKAMLRLYSAWKK